MTPSDRLAAAEARRRFVREVVRREGEIDLARAALALADEEDAGCDVEASLAALGRMGEEAGAQVRDYAGAPVVALNRYLFEELGFSGNREHYNDPRNSFLHRVIERRTGLPITLSIVYMEVGRRAGLAIEGVGFPGHFIVRVGGGGASPPVLVDPFNREIIDEEDCQHRLDEVYGGQVPLTDEHLRAASKREILVRILTNLKGVYAQAQLYRRALAAVERILIVAPHAVSERRDRGMLLAQLDRLHEAAADVQAYLRLNENAPDADNVREHLKKIQMRLAMLN
jgi:regulator of sirC expression with transglutaminase-like and TPR domain